MDCEANTFFGVMNAFRGLNVFSLLPLSRQEYMLMFLVFRHRKTNPEDRRNTYVTLTAAGETEVQRANQLLEEFHRGIQKRFTQEESDQLMELLRRLYTAASEELDEMKGEKQANG